FDVPRNDFLTPEDRVLTMEADEGAFSAEAGAGHITGAHVPSVFGTDTVKVRATADSAFYFQHFVHAMDGVPSGNYTFVFEIVVYGDPVKCVYGLGETDELTVTQGRHIICKQFTWDANNPTKAIGLRVGLKQGTEVSFFPFRLFR